MKHISIIQLAAYLLPGILGMLIICAAWQFHADTDTALAASPGADGYITVNKPVRLLGQAEPFSPEELDTLRSQPWVLDAAGFIANRFEVSASVNLGDRRMATDLFLESVPDEYIDDMPSGWNAVAPDGPVPVLIPQSYLALYNFGFAPAQGLPQITETLLGALPLTLTLSHGDRAERHSAYVAGLTSRLNTIVVPRAWLTAANERLVPGVAEAPERLIVHVTSPDDPAIAGWLDSHGLERDDDGQSSSLGTLANAATAAIGSIGLVISVMSLIILWLGIGLLIQKSRDVLRRLVSLGYTPGALARHYTVLVAVLNVVIALAGFGLMLPLRHIWTVPLADSGLPCSTVGGSAVLAVAIMAVVTVVAAGGIHRSMRRMWRND